LPVMKAASSPVLRCLKIKRSFTLEPSDSIVPRT
jgi:hypothetical protein